MDRRTFFKQAAKKTAQTVVKQVDQHVSERASHWIRPPFALDELEFLLACTRCDDCINACSYGVIFSLSAKLGGQVAGTPALDLLNKGCHLCADWPCVTACPNDALGLNKTDTKQSLPRLAQAQIDTATCLPYSGPECGACQGSCPVPEAMTWENERPIINQEHCTGCGLCREVCILESKAITIQSIQRAVE